MRGVIYITSGSTIGQAISLLAYTIIARLYTPEDMGYLSLYLSFILVTTSLVTLQYSLAVISADNDSDALNLVFISIAILPITATLIGILFFVLIQQDLLGFGELPDNAVWLAVPSLIFTSMFSTLRYWLLRFQQYDTVAFVSIWQNLGRVVVQLVLGLISFDWLGLVLGEIAGRAFAAGAVWRATRERFREIGLQNTISNIPKVLLRYRQFPTLTTPSMFINALATNITIPLLIQAYGIASGGFFGLTHRLLAAPASLISNSFADVYHSQFAELYRSNPARCPALFWQTAKRLVLIAIPPTLLVMFFVPDLFAFLLGEEWRMSGQIAVTLLPVIASQFIVVPLTRTIYILERVQVKFIYDILSLITPLLVVWYATSMKLPFLTTVTALNLVNILTYVVYFFLIAQIIKSTIRPNIEVLDSTE